MDINKDVGQPNAIEKFQYRDPEHNICSAYWFWAIMLTQQK